MRSRSGTGTVSAAPNMSPELSCFGIWSTVLALKTFALPSACRRTRPSTIAPRLCAFGFPRYTATASRFASKIGPSPCSISANASSQLTSCHTSPLRTCGVRNRSGSASSCLSAVPFGHR